MPERTPEQKKMEALPKWAQTEIRTLQRDKQYLIDALEQGPERSTVFARRAHDALTPLGEHTDVLFTHDYENSFEGFEVRWRGDGDLFVAVRGAQSMGIIPIGANCCKIREVEYVDAEARRKHNGR